MDQEETRRLLIEDLADLWHQLVALETGEAVESGGRHAGDPLRLQGAVEMGRTAGHALSQPLQALALSISNLQQRLPAASPLRSDVDQVVDEFLRLRTTFFKLQKVRRYRTCDCGQGQRMIDLERAAD